MGLRLRFRECPTGGDSEATSEIGEVIEWPVDDGELADGALAKDLRVEGGDLEKKSLRV